MFKSYKKFWISSTYLDYNYYKFSDKYNFYFLAYVYIFRSYNYFGVEITI